MKQQAAAVFCCLLNVRTDDIAEMMWSESWGFIKRSNKAIQTGELSESVVNVDTLQQRIEGPSFVVTMIVIDGKSIWERVINKDTIDWTERANVVIFTVDENDEVVQSMTMKIE